MLQADSYALKEQNKWFCLQKLQITADLRKGFASGRWTFDSSLPQYKQTLIELKEIADKLSLLYGEDVLFIPSTPIGFSIPSELAGLNFQLVKSPGQGMLKSAGDGYELLDTPSLDWETVYGLLKISYLPHSIYPVDSNRLNSMYCPIIEIIFWRWTDTPKGFLKI